MSGPFSIGEVVKFKGSSRADRVEGVIKHITCSAATKSGGETCDRKTCPHKPKDRIWVKWTNGSLCSYEAWELETDIAGEENIVKAMEALLASEEENDAVDAAKVISVIQQNRRKRAESPPEKVVSSMSSSSSLMDMIKEDGGKAAYRVAARQINNGLRNAIVEMMKRKGADNAQLEGVAMFLETEWGAALLGTVAGHGLAYIPALKDDPRIVRLAKEFRVSSMTTVGNELFDIALGELMPVVKKALAALPEEASAPQTTEGHKSTEEVEDPEIEIETDLSSLEDHMAEKEDPKRMVLGG